MRGRYSGTSLGGGQGGRGGRGHRRNRRLECKDSAWRCFCDIFVRCRIRPEVKVVPWMEELNHCQGVSIPILQNVARHDARDDGDILGFLRDLLELVFFVGEESIEEDT